MIIDIELRIFRDEEFIYIYLLYCTSISDFPWYVKLGVRIINDIELRILEIKLVLI